MYKLVVLFALVAVAVAAPKPGLLAAPALAYSSVVGAVPTSISSHSSSVVHSAAIAAPIVHAAPAVVAAPAITAYAAPAITVAHHAAPLISTVHGIHGGLIL